LGGAILLVLVGSLRPRWLAPVFTSWMVAAFPIAWLVSMAVLGLIFFGLFLPMAIAFRLIGRDPLNRQPRRAQESYWSDKPPAPDVKRYFRQF
jgi:hypothetical protein